MKKMTFAFACASAVAAFASAPDPVISSINFEDYTAGFTGLSLAGDDGTEVAATASRWLYDGGASGATDGSTVKAYDPAITGNANYLELSTEGGTLWRSINTLADSETLGAAQEIPASTGLYVDTMVQFTPTEDGGAPELGDDDKLAIWLNVTAGENGAPSTTNLCVRALSYTDGELTTPDPATFTLARVDGEPLVVDAGSWHRLTVEAVQNVFASAEGYYLPAFTIKFDGVELCATTTPFPVAKDTLVDPDGELLSADMKALVSADRIFPSLQGMLGEEQVAGLSAVGFKGSGAIDNLQFTTQDPNADPEVLIDLTISADNATVTGITAGKVAVGAELSFTVEAVEGYNLTGVTVNGTAVTADAEGNYTYTVAAGVEAVAVVVTTEAIPSIDWDNPKQASGTAAEMFGITGALADADGGKLATWAKGVGNVSFEDAASIEVDAFLLNCANTDDAITAAKATFKIISIEQDEDGAWVAKVTGEKGDGAEYGNGYVVIKGAATVDGDYDLATTDETAKFFKAFLVLEAPAAE